ncbi:uncharacterized protein LOC110024794 [Phalaenopsis equestris]|uniref:uncharacterized protein LOC110024794 n=1 Tax=Phalaenopsis equestris TaxID=78828 RepID=UPI0009E1CC5C|nr:uncharacterized protein LOC110024794 [Phalaenopsis equestris]
MEGNELEEGEACYGLEDDIDPDDLSYIDEKLQHVLGHCQKEFEGVVSAETLGAKFGAYGSFLPAYQRSPPILLSQPKSPAKEPAHNLSRSPYNSQPELSCQNASFPANASIPEANNAYRVQPIEKSCKKDTCINSCSTEGITQYESAKQTMDIRDPKSLKVRIKVGPDTVSTINKPEIYSDLGLDVSPSPSHEDSLGGSRELSSESPNTFCESPSTILQIMTSFPVPGGYLLSPLSATPLHLLEKEDTSIEKFKRSMPCKAAVDNCTASSDTSLHAKDVRDFPSKEKKSREKCQKLVQAHVLTCENVITMSSKNEIGSKTAAAQKNVLTGQDMVLSSSAPSADANEETDVGGNSIKECSKMFDIHNEPKKILKMDGAHALDLRKDNHLDFTDNMGMDDNLDKETIPSKGKTDAKSHFTEKAFGEANGKFVICNKSKGKSQKNPARKRADSDIYKMRKDYNAGFEEHVREQAAQKTCLSEKTVFKVVQSKDQTFEGGKIIKGTQNNEPNKEKKSTVLSGAPKGIKKMSHLKGSHLETMSKMSKPPKELSKGQNIESQSELLMNAQAQQVDHVRHFLGSSRSTEKSNEKSEVNKVQNFPSAELANDAPAPINDGVPNNNLVPASPALVLIEDNWVCCDLCQQWRLLPYGTNTESLPKKWQCSMQVWLPGLNSCNVSQDETTKAFHELYQFPAPGSEPNLAGHLAASSVTSADTQNPGRGLEIFLKKHGSMDATDLPIESALTYLPNSSKNIFVSSGYKDFNDAGYCMGMASLIKPKPALKGRSVDIAAEKRIHKQKEKLKTEPSFKVGGDSAERLGKYSKPMNKRGADVDGHRLSKKFKKDASYHSTKDVHSSVDMSSKIVINGDTEFLTKVPRNTSQNYSDHFPSKGSKPKSASSRKSMEQVNSFNGKHMEISSASEAEKSDKFESNDKKRKLKEWREEQACQEISVSGEQAAGSRPILKQSLIDSELRRHKKVKVAKSEGKSRAIVGGGNFEMKGCSTRIGLSSNRKHPTAINVNEGLRPSADEQMAHYKENAMSGQTLDCVDSLKRDVTNVRFLAAATSSSSKVSGSQKGKVNLLEARGSPVESVSSSPMRILNNENNFSRRNSSIKDTVISMVYSGTGSPKRFSDGELDGSSDQSGTRAKDQASNDCLRSSGIYRSSESGALDSLKGSHDYQDIETNCLPGVKSIDGKYSEVVKHDDISSTDPCEAKVVFVNGNVPHHPEKYHLEQSDNNHICDEDQHCTSGVKNSLKNSSHMKEKRRNLNNGSDKGKLKVLSCSTEQKDFQSVRTCNTGPADADFDHLNSIKNENMENHSKKQKNHDLRDAIGGVSRTKLAPQQILQKSSSHEREATGQSTVGIGKGMHSSSTTKDKLEKKVGGPPKAPDSVKGANLEQYSVDAENNEILKSTKQLKNNDEQNGTLPNLLRQSATSVPGSSSPMKKDGHSSVNALIKEARDLKHTAHRLKSVGLEDESSGIFFESALKFLFAASLLEPSNADNARQGELVPSNQMMMMYYETAKFCEFCAYEFERLKQMVASALAYKCAEVAYLKVAYYKHPSASKDRLELQVALDAPLIGESPSSSASDIDNLNNHGGLDKVVSVRPISSPQIPSNHAIASRNRPHVMRLLTYTNYLNCAFEATKKSQNAIAAASTDLGKNGIEACSASRVLDFNFHNVEGLLRLVRLSMNSIGH